METSSIRSTSPGDRDSGMCGGSKQNREFDALDVTGDGYREMARWSPDFQLCLQGSWCWCRTLVYILSLMF